MVGGSLGGYILMEFIGREPELCSRVVVMMAGQDVGVNRGMMASLGLWAMGKATSFSSQAGIAKMFMKAASGNTHLNRELIEELSKSGMFFKHSEENINLLKETIPQQALSRAVNTRCLFINGEKDHRNSEEIWLQTAAKGSKLVVYEGGDHFFSHDNRFIERLIEDMENFIK
jgi:pimeloyl-ACP methyl ester carboxylesterase